jgi:hypothetical protein
MPNQIAACLSDRAANRRGALLRIRLHAQRSVRDEESRDDRGSLEDRQGRLAALHVDVAGALDRGETILHRLSFARPNVAAISSKSAAVYRAIYG